MKKSPKFWNRVVISLDLKVNFVRMFSNKITHLLLKNFYFSPNSNFILTTFWLFVQNLRFECFLTLTLILCCVNTQHTSSIFYSVSAHGGETVLKGRKSSTKWSWMLRNWSKMFVFSSLRHWYLSYITVFSETKIWTWKIYFFLFYFKSSLSEMWGLIHDACFAFILWSFQPWLQMFKLWLYVK